MAARWTVPRIVTVGTLAVAGLAALIVMNPPLLLSSSTPTGGDMGAHVYIPAYLRDNLLSDFRITGWSNGWYAGFPILYFYFPLPALTIVLLDLVPFVSYGVAFKLVTVMGVVGLPFAAYFLMRSIGLSRPVSAVSAAAGGTFVYMESHTIFGGNIPATLAREYSFSWSLALSLVYLGLVIRASRRGQRFSAAAGIFLALTALSHLITTLVVIAASLPILFRRRGGSPVLGSWGVGFALAGFWALPLLARASTFTTDMGWNPVRGMDKVFPRELWVVVVLASIGLVWLGVKRLDVMPLAILAVLPIAGYLLISEFDFTKLYNARLLPYWYLTAFLLAGAAVGLFVTEVTRRTLHRETWLAVGTGSAALLFLVAGLSGISFLGSWAKWNYTGYEGKGEAWTEYSTLMTTIDSLPPGRVMWEANSDMNRYGTPMALMLFPYWSEDHPSMEGLLFESSLTTPFHFLNAAEVSERPSNPIGGLKYHNLDFDRAMDHLPLYNVRYYVSFTDIARVEASKHMEILAESPPWTVFAAPDSGLVDVAQTVPVVYEGDESFVEASLAWYDDVDNLDQWLVEGGPAEWPRTEAARPPFTTNSQPTFATGEVSDVVLEDDRISFHTTAVGIPHLVKVSDFPNWKARGAEGPWRAAPSLMVVVPTQEDVEIVFENTWAETGGWLLTLGALAGLGTMAWIRRRRRDVLSGLRERISA